MTTTALDLLDRLRGLDFYRDQVVTDHDLPARAASPGQPAGGLAEPIRRALATRGISSLWSHQSRAIETVRAGQNVVVVTGTASGKTLCYNIPVLETALADPLATALYVFPTKALAQDQWRGLEALREASGVDLLSGTYDGDTPPDLRRRLRDRGSVLLTNPDMLHAGILPHHARWSRFFTHLKFVVLDEVHAYRGVFGSHVANVMRRLGRIARHYGASPRFVACSATIANPAEHAGRVAGAPMEVVEEDGAPRGGKRFVLWNPPPLADPGLGGESAKGGGDRKSALMEAVNLLVALVKEGIQTIVFTRTRLAAELVMKNARDRLRPLSRKLADSIAAYRGGYLPEDRRAIERRLANREILGVASTNALELGIDIGSLDACVIVGYPGTVASLWQQAGRAGRGQGDSLVFLVAQNTPIDQFLANHPDWIFARTPERAVTDPDNPHVCVGHLACAAHEIRLTPEDAARFGPLAEPILEILEEDGKVKRIGDDFYHASSDYPAADVSLRNLAGPIVTIQDGDRVIGTLDELSALTQLHDHAIYLHAGETYFVDELDLASKIAHVSKQDLDYYTQAVTASQIRIDTREEEQEYAGGALGFGEVTVTTSIPMFKKVRFHSRESLGFEKLELPPQELETVATWLAPPAEALEEIRRRGADPGEALVGIANVLVEVVPVYLMCDTGDIGAAVDASQLGRDALYLYDRFPGGMGYAKGAMDRFGEILATVRKVVDECACDRGCPSCVGAAVPAVAATDMDTAVRGRIPDKDAARRLLAAIAGVAGVSSRT